MKTPVLKAVAVVASWALLSVAWAQTELISDNHFADGGASWDLRVASDAVAELSIEGKDAEAVLKIQVNAPDVIDAESAPDVRVQKAFGTITEGKEYKIRFQARAEEPALVVGFIYPATDGARVAWRQEVALTKDWEDHEFTFTGRESAEDCVLGFAKLGAKTNTLSFRHIVLVEK